jgi:hypothetical protein
VDNVKVRYSGVNDSKAFARGIDFRINGEFVSGFESWLNISILETKEKYWASTIKMHLASQSLGCLVLRHVSSQAPCIFKIICP